LLLNTRLLTARRRPRRLATIASVALVLVPLACTTSTASGPYFSFVGGGNGHGVGLSQFGALGRADAGQNVVQIIAAYYPGATGTARGASTIRVRIGDVPSTTVTQFGGTMVGASNGVTPIIAAGPGQAMTLSRSGGSVMAQVAGGATVDLGPTGYVGFTQGTPVSVGATGHRYRWGRLVVRPSSSGGLQLVLDQLSLEKWTDGIAEVPASWPVAALQAQAVAARTYGAWRQAHPRNANYDVDQLAGDGTYTGFDREGSTYGSRWIQAVDSTANLVLTYGGVPIQAFYSASNGGYTESSAYVFVASLPYLQANPDPLDAAPGNPASSWTRSYTGAELGAWLRASGRPDIGDVVGIELLGGLGASGRVDKAAFRIHGTTGATDLVTGDQLRAAVNAAAPAARDLLSTKFSIRGGAQPG
jgi:stage II sporulation protein D